MTTGKPSPKTAPIGPGDIVDVQSINATGSTVTIRCTVGDGYWEAITTRSPNLEHEVVSITPVDEAA